MKKIAILIILSLFLSGCASRNVMAPDRFLPEKCSMPAGLACIDFTATSESVTLTIQNSMGFSLDNVELNLADRDVVSHTCVPKGDNIMDDGEQEVFVCTGEFQPGKLGGVISMSYTNTANGLNSIKSGQIVAMVEK